jgi:hypothetical protein
MNRLSIARFSPVVLVLVLLLVGCGTQANVALSQSSPSAAGAAASPSATEPVASPSAEGTGPESPQQADNGGPAIAVAKLPVGGGPGPGNSTNDTDICFSLALNISPALPSGVEVTVTEVDVSTPAGSPQFALVDGSVCPESSNQPCQRGFKFSAGSAGCDVDVMWDPSNPPTADGSLVVEGTPSCPPDDTATCQGYLEAWEGQGSSIPIPAPSGQSPADTSSP